MDNPNLQLPEKNNYDEQAASFSRSRHYRQLQHKYREEPYEDAFRPLYYLALIFGFLANALSIVTGFAFVFAFAFALVARLPYPAGIATVFALVILIGLEILQRFLGSHYFRYWLQYGYQGQYASRLHGLLIGMILAAAASTYISYSGGFSFTEYASTKPTKATAPQKDLTALDTEYDPLISAAAQEADAYRRSKLWRGRLSDRDAAKYNSLLAEKNRLVQQKLDAKASASSWNETQLAQVDSSYTAALQLWQQDIQRKGTNLGHFTIFFILLLHFCMWYTEYYDFRTAIQYAHPQSKNQSTAATHPAPKSQPAPALPLSAPAPPSASAPDPRLDRLENLLLQLLQAPTQSPPASAAVPDAAHPPVSEPPIQPSSNGIHQATRTIIQGFRTPELSPSPTLSSAEDELPSPDLLAHVRTPDAQLLDIFTILHHDRNSAEPKRYSLREVENFISTYEARLKEAQEQGKKDAVIRNRTQRLNYWRGRKAELLEKINAQNPEALIV